MTSTEALELALRIAKVEHSTCRDAGDNTGAAAAARIGDEIRRQLDATQDRDAETNRGPALS